MNNACIVGYGAVGTVHATAVEKTDNVNLYAVCDNDSNKIKCCTEKFSSITSYADFDEMLDDDNITSVHICTPHYLHFIMAKKAIIKGKDVVIEKPVTMLEAEYNELKALCETMDNKVCVMFQNRSSNCVSELKRLCDTSNGITGIYAALTWHRDMDYYNHDEWRGKWKTEGGGVLINQAIHLLDMISYIGGGVLEACGSISTKALDIEVEDTADALLTLNNGAKACFYATNAHVVNSPFRLEVECGDTILKYENKKLYKFTGSDCELIASDTDNYCGKSYWGNGHERVIHEFYNGGAYTTVSDSENTMRTLFAIYRSAKNGNRKETII